MFRGHCPVHWLHWTGARASTLAAGSWRLRIPGSAGIPLSTGVRAEGVVAREVVHTAIVPHLRVHRRQLTACSLPCGASMIGRCSAAYKIWCSAAAAPASEHVYILRCVCVPRWVMHQSRSSSTFDVTKITSKGQRLFVLVARKYHKDNPTATTLKGVKLTLKTAREQGAEGGKRVTFKQGGVAAIIGLGAQVGHEGTEAELGKATTRPLSLQRTRIRTVALPFLPHRRIGEGAWQVEALILGA